MMEKEIWENTGQPESGDTLDPNNMFDNSSAQGDTSTEAKEIEKLKAEVAEYKEKYLRQVAEFDNFRKRNSRERLELIQTAGKDVIVSMLDVLDDCDRAQQQVEKSLEDGPAKEGILLVFNKLRNTLFAKGLKPMESKGQEFNPDLH